MKHPVNSSSAWYLKNMGYPQPDLREGQTWVNLFDHVSILIELVISNHGIVGIFQQESGTFHAILFPNESRIAYIPTLEEIPGYQEGMTETDAVQQWVNAHGNRSNI